MGHGAHTIIFLKGEDTVKLLSIVVPCYNEQEVLPLFYDKITEVMSGMKTEFPELDYEVVFINDGSGDKTLEGLRKYARMDSRIRYISFSRNFGKEAGMFAGLEASKGDYVVVMDADLQHPPEYLPEMYRYVKSGEFDCATTRRVDRDGESKIRSWFARRFYEVMNKISQTEIVDGAQDFRFMSRQMVDAILSMREYNRFSKGIFSWVGFRTRYIEIKNVERAAGTTAWSFWGLFKYSLEGIVAFSTAPLAIASLLGIISCALAVVFAIITIIMKLAFHNDPSGYPTIVCLILLFGGLQLFTTGILGQYLAKTYMECKKRPVYLVQETEEDLKKSTEPETEL